MRHARRDRELVARVWNATVRNERFDPAGGTSDLAQTIARLHAGDDAPPPDPSFARRLEERLMLSSPPARSSAIDPWRPAAIRGLTLRWTSLPAAPSRGSLAAAVLLILVAIAAVIGLSRTWSRGDEQVGTSVPAAQVSSPAAGEQNGTPPAGAAAHAVPAVPGCTTEPREPGRVERLFSEGAWVANGYALFPRDSGDVKHAPAFLDGDTYVDHFTEGAADQATIDAINATLAQLDACHYYIFAPDGQIDVDSRYFGNFSDDYFRLQFADPAYAGVSRTFWALWTPRPGVAPVVERAWRTTDGRVMATVLNGWQSALDARTVMIFVKIGDRWLVEEIAQTVVFDALPAPPEPADDGIETLEIVIYDADASRWPSVDGNYSFLGQYASDYPFYADGGLIIRLVNLGTQPHRFASPKLGIERTLAPGDLVDIPIDAPVGSYDWSLYEGDGSEPTATHTLVFVAPGTPRGLG